MNKKKLTLLISIIFLFTSCAGSWDSVKRGLTGQKAKSGDEFMVRKKDPLILPPDFDKLPTPDERALAEDEISEFEKKLEISTLSEDISSSASSTEESILQQIRKK